MIIDREEETCAYIGQSILGRMGYIHRDWERERGHKVVIHTHRHRGTDLYMYMHIPKSCNIQTFNGEDISLSMLLRLQDSHNSLTHSLHALHN